jgi:hypothetical protein
MHEKQLCRSSETTRHMLKDDQHQTKGLQQLSPLLSERQTLIKVETRG